MNKKILSQKCKMQSINQLTKNTVEMDLHHVKNRIEHVHRSYHLPSGKDIPTVNIAGKSHDTILLERRLLRLSMNLYPDGIKHISYHAYFFSGQSNDTMLFMDDLRVHMHSFLCNFYGVDCVCFRFIYKEKMLRKLHESNTTIQHYLDENYHVRVHVWK